MKDSKVQIEGQLFREICLWFLIDGAADQERYDRIRSGLESKLDAMARRELYSQSKTAPTEAEREKARRAYLDEIGMPEDWRY